MTVAASRGATGSRSPSVYSRATSTTWPGSGTGGMGILMLMGASTRTARPRVDSWGGSQLDDDLDLDRGVERQRGHTDRRACVHTRVGEDRAEQLRCAVRDPRLRG